MFDALLVQIGTSYIHMPLRSNEPQLGQYYIAEYASTKGVIVKVKKYTSNQPILEDLVKRLKDNNCKIVGFYVDSENLWTIRRITLLLKDRIPDLCVIVGGPQVTSDPHLAFKRIPNVTYAIVGEGEIPFTELILQKNTQSDISNIKGVCYIDESNRFHYTGGQPMSRCLDDYPYPRRKEYCIDEGLLFDQISTGRGCIGKCSFCFEGSKKENRLRLRSIKNVIEEIDYVISNLTDSHYVSFLDDTFIINPERTRTICNHLIDKYDGKIGWFCEARADILIKNIELLPLMKRAGLIRVQLGGESGSQEILDLYNKNMKIEDLLLVVEAIYKSGIPSTYINFIVGGAKESLESFNKTLELAKRLIDIAPGCAEVGCSLFSPYAGTPMRNNPEIYGLKLIDTDLLRGPDGHTPFVETEKLDKFKILQLKSIFEQEIRVHQLSKIKEFSKEEILCHYYFFKNYGMATNWYTLCNEVESINNYFSAISSYSFSSFNDMSIDEIRGSVPYRTSQPISDGEKFYRIVFGDKYVENTPLEDAVFMLSSGKISFAEIVNILSRSSQFMTVQNLEEEIINVYKKFDNEYSVVWKNFI